MSFAPPIPVRIAAILLAGGTGSRIGRPQPKQFRLLAGRAVLAHSLQALREHPGVSDVMIVTPEGLEDESRIALGDLAQGVRFTIGGATRRLSVANAISALEESGSPPTHILIHDSARPILPAHVIDRLIAALASGADGAMPVLPVADTLVIDQRGAAGDVVDRSTLRRVQTPQAFAFETIAAAHRNWSGSEEPTDDAQMLRATGAQIALIEGDARLEKITYPGDHERMERQLSAQLISRTGMGFDVHRLVPNEELWLCGVQVPHTHGLSGHSDADVAIHALVDAILGALAEGDIGSHFPPSDPQWRGAQSDRFLAFAMERVAARGGLLDHADVTIICEAPKIGPRRDAMRQRLAQIMGVGLSQISVKATTTERLGLTGRGEGIAAQAIATLRLPENQG